MKLGVFFIGSHESGGLYQYSLCILDSLKDRSDKVIIFNLSGADFPHEKYRDYFKISSSLRLTSQLKRCVVNLFPKSEPTRTTQAKGIKKEEFSKKNGLVSIIDILFLRLIVKLNRIDLLIFTTPSPLSFKLRTPYIMPIHDLQHRLNPQFPEVSAGGIWEKREYLYSNSIPNAKAILVDSETSKEDLLNFYPTDRKKVKLLPFIPPNYILGDYTEEKLNKIRGKYDLPPRFLFYPANFWRHKNHELIIQALNHIKENHDLRIPIVFVGSKQVPYSQFDKVRELTNTFGLEDQVHYLGYVSNEDMGRLYKLAAALVMPTFFGPTNIPYLEAFALGCPVIGSDIRGVREQIGNSGLLIDPNSHESLVAAILKVWTDAELRETLIRRGYDKIESWNFDQFSDTLNKIINEAETKLASMR